MVITRKFEPKINANERDSSNEWKRRWFEGHQNRIKQRLGHFKFESKDENAKWEFMCAWRLNQFFFLSRYNSLPQYSHPFDIRMHFCAARSKSSFFFHSSLSSSLSSTRHSLVHHIVFLFSRKFIASLMRDFFSLSFLISSSNAVAEDVTYNL